MMPGEGTNDARRFLVAVFTEGKEGMPQRGSPAHTIVLITSSQLEPLTSLTQ